MADTKISNLTELTALADDDVLPLVDDSVTTTKKISAHNLGVYINSLSIPAEAYYLTWTGTAGTNNDDVVYTSPDVSEFNTHTVECTAGTVDVWGSMDGTNYSPVALAGHAVNNTTATTRAITCSSGNQIQIFGKWKVIRVDQNGSTASNARGSHGNT